MKSDFLKEYFLKFKLMLIKRREKRRINKYKNVEKRKKKLKVGKKKNIEHANSAMDVRPAFPSELTHYYLTLV